MDYMSNNNNRQSAPVNQFSTHPQARYPYNGNADFLPTDTNNKTAGYPQQFMAAPLGAFENSSDNTKEMQQLQQQQQYQQQQMQMQQQQQQMNLNLGSNYQLKSHESMGEMSNSDVSPATPTVYPYRARAVYTCKFFPFPLCSSVLPFF